MGASPGSRGSNPMSGGNTLGRSFGGSRMGQPRIDGDFMSESGADNFNSRGGGGNSGGGPGGPAGGGGFPFQNRLN